MDTFIKTYFYFTLQTKRAMLLYKKFDFAIFLYNNITATCFYKRIHNIVRKLFLALFLIVSPSATILSAFAAEYSLSLPIIPDVAKNNPYLHENMDNTIYTQGFYLNFRDYYSKNSVHKPLSAFFQYFCLAPEKDGKILKNSLFTNALWFFQSQFLEIPTKNGAIDHKNISGIENIAYFGNFPFFREER